ncbi:hypothetical protein [Xanthobacter sediminis]
MTRDDLLAAEYVIGTLDAAERAEVRTRIALDVSFAARVGAWEQALTPLYELVTPIAPPPSLWRAISEDVDASRRGRSRKAQEADAPAEADAPSADAAPSAAGRPRRRREGAAPRGIGGALGAPFRAVSGLVRRLGPRRPAAGEAKPSEAPALPAPSPAFEEMTRPGRRGVPPDVAPVVSARGGADDGVPVSTEDATPSVRPPAAEDAGSVGPEAPLVAVPPEWPAVPEAGGPDTPVPQVGADEVPAAPAATESSAAMEPAASEAPDARASVSASLAEELGGSPPVSVPAIGEAPVQVGPHPADANASATAPIPAEGAEKSAPQGAPAGSARSEGMLQPDIGETPSPVPASGPDTAAPPRWVPAWPKIAEARTKRVISAASGPNAPGRKTSRMPDAAPGAGPSRGPAEGDATAGAADPARAEADAGASGAGDGAAPLAPAAVAPEGSGIAGADDLSRAGAAAETDEGGETNAAPATGEDRKAIGALKADETPEVGEVPETGHILETGDGTKADEGAKAGEAPDAGEAAGTGDAPKAGNASEARAAPKAGVASPPGAGPEPGVADGPPALRRQTPDVVPASRRARLLWGGGALAAVIAVAVGADFLAQWRGDGAPQPRAVVLTPIYVANPPPEVRLRLDARSGQAEVHVAAPPAPPGRIYRLRLKTEKTGTHLLGTFASNLAIVSDLGLLLSGSAPGTARLSVTLDSLDDPDTPGEEIYDGRITG